MPTLYVRIRGRTQGPFESEKLRALVRSGQLARFHEVSENNLNWRKASDFPELFESLPNQDINQGTGTASNSSPQRTTAAVLSPAQPNLALLGDERQWHYAVGNTAYGPVDTRALKDLVGSAALGPDDQVWHDGMSNWEVWHAVPELAALSSPLIVSAVRRPKASGSFLQLHAKSIAIGATLAVLMLLLGAGFLMYSDPDAPLAKPPKHEDPRAITSIEQLNSIRAAVGKVVCGWEVLFADGRKLQFPWSMGSAFAVSEDGFMLTNKHVIEEFDNLTRAEETRLEYACMESTGLMRRLDKYSKQPLPEEEAKKFNDLIKSLRQSIPEQIQKATPKLWVFVMDEAHGARVVDTHSSADLAILKIDHRFPKTFSLCAASPEPLLDAEVRAVGFPGTAMTAFSEEEQAKLVATNSSPKDVIDLVITNEIGKPSNDIATSFERRHLQYVITNGNVSQVSPDGATGLHWLQHSAAISGGNSGGPLMDRRAVVLGVNTSVVINEAASVFRAFCLSQSDIRKFIDKNVGKDVKWVQEWQ